MLFGLLSSPLGKKSILFGLNGNTNRSTEIQKVKTKHTPLRSAAQPRTWSPSPRNPQVHPECGPRAHALIHGPNNYLYHFEARRKNTGQSSQSRSVSLAGVRFIVLDVVERLGAQLPYPKVVLEPPLGDVSCSLGCAFAAGMLELVVLITRHASVAEAILTFLLSPMALKAWTPFKQPDASYKDPKIGPQIYRNSRMGP